VSDTYQRLRDAIATLSIEPLKPEDFPDPVHKRLVQALRVRSFGEPTSVGDGDIAGLLRHLLARERAKYSNAEPTLVLAKSSLWPSLEALEAAGLSVSTTDAYWTLRVVPWRPSWLASTESYEPGAAAIAEIARRANEPVRGDPFLSIVERTQYRSLAQREAVRAVVSMPPGSTLLVNLPTGAGKSLCAHVPALLEGRKGRLTVIVVPTTALAIDQERALSGRIAHETAFYATETDDLQRRNGILSRIRSGEQQVVFTSPESLLGPLQKAVSSVARDGRLAFLVVDEAHMVEQWGDGFRSSFQELSGFRTNLLRSSPSAGEVRTLLLTATLTAECLATLRGLFATEAANFRLVSAAQLRPEPEYWIAKAPDENKKSEWVMEALLRLPRSIILYVTRPEQAIEWLERIRKAGILRSACVHGQTPNASRERILKQWQNHEVDIIVATSAFGLGMDQADVRAIVHATVPENIDRFYQEVGRGGRDGIASVSLTVYTAIDVESAERLNRTTIISMGRGRQRWQMMFTSDKRQALGHQEYRVPVDVVPSYDPSDYEMFNDRNTEWNVRTLTLMQRAGIIALRAEVRDSACPPASDSSSDSESDVPYRLVRVLETDHLGESTWKQRVDPERERSAARDARSFELMREALFAQHCLAEVFAATYTIQGDARLGGVATVRVVRACGGCPWCRSKRAPTSQGVLPRPRPVWHVWGPLGESVGALLGDRTTAVFYDYGEEERCMKLMWWLVSQGLRHVVISDDLYTRALRALPEPLALNKAPSVTVLSEYERVTAPSVPTVVLLSGTSVPANVIDSVGSDEQYPVHVYLLPKRATSTSHPHRLLRDVFSGHRYSLAELEGGLLL
jgi:ATP-dependent DNA helicase RecQ